MEILEIAAKMSGFRCRFCKGSLMKVHYPKLYNMAHLLALNVLLLPKDLTIISINDDKNGSHLSIPEKTSLRLFDFEYQTGGRPQIIFTIQSFQTRICHFLSVINYLFCSALLIRSIHSQGFISSPEQRAQE